MCAVAHSDSACVLSTVPSSCWSAVCRARDDPTSTLRSHSLLHRYAARLVRKVMLILFVNIPLACSAFQTNKSSGSALADALQQASALVPYSWGG